MVYASRSRLALSPIPQNESNHPSSATSAHKASRLAPFPTADHTRRSVLRAKLAHASTALLRSPSLASQASCFVEIPLIAYSPASMPLAQVRAGLKRKKRARDQLGRGSNNAKYSDRSSGGANVPDAESRIAALAASGLRRNASRRNKGLNIITSPHLPRDRPSSSASELSDWSSVVSVSPTTSRAPTLKIEDSSDKLQTRPGIQTRRSSRNSLHRTLDGMTLEDSLPFGLGLHRSSRSHSQSRNHPNSNHTAGNAEEDHSCSRPQRAVTSSAAPDSDHSSTGSADMDDQEAEHARLISRAPNWQLHRLRKDELIQLCVKAGAWDAAPTEEALELLTKHDLVNQIITCRSRLDRSQSSNRRALGSTRRHQRGGHSSEQSDSVVDEDAEDIDALWMGSSSHQASHRIGKRSQGASPSNSADDRDADLTDASNEAGGEETEAEPPRSPTTRRHTGRSSHAKVRGEATLRRMDSSTFDELEPSKTNQAPRRQLRDKTSLRDAIGRRLRIANGSEAFSTSTSSSVFGGRSSRASNTSHSPFVHRHQLNVFVASSPIRTRSRTARLTIGLPSRRKAETRGFGASDASFAALDSMATPKLGHRTQRVKKSVKFNAAPSNASNGQAEDEWMEDPSSDEAVAITLRSNVENSRAVKRRGSRKGVRSRRSTADSDASLTSHQPRSRSASAELPSEVEVESRIIGQGEDDDMATSDDDAPTPTKFRKLRNGKLRLIAGTFHRSSEAHAPANGQSDDVDMESDDRSASTSRSRKERTESPESDTAPSEGIENAMVQPTFTTLTRLRKSELEQLCLHREIGINEDDKKANLIKKLLDWYQLTELEAANADGFDSEHEGDADETRSDVSTATATAEDESVKAAQRTPTRRRNTRANSNVHPAATDSDQPLLLRARGKAVSSDKLPTPPLTSNNDEANPPQAGDGVDELNGLDLESLNLTDKEIPPSKLEKLEKIGSGGFKDVYVGKYRISKTRINKVAIADIRDQLTEMDIKELSLLRDLRHENIVRFIGVSIPEDPRHVPCMIVSELCSNGDLFDYIRNTPAPSDAEVFRILLETARGLEYLHTRTPAIIHRDCKSTNVLITRRKTAKINDFGLARVKNTSRSMMKSLVGTVNWQAVELWVPKPHYNEKVDVWSAAMTFWEALQWHQPEKKYPFQGMNEHQIYQDVGQKRQRPYTGFIRRQFGGEIVDLLDRMWDQTPKNRPSMTEVCKELEQLILMKKEAAAGGSGRGKG
ncbi:uncharacterized protein UTRI_03870_B [Ustilago trichophora]|uniref:Protein kinase domain-containing protein n=1 Tax=Ustilago trichophora TaxID=86804 RepID=A0A5C3DYS0_9BASI|nr:uncharacterized protein UTRI_03870_B [Ustilago trichophora]